MLVLLYGGYGGRRRGRGRTLLVLDDLDLSSGPVLYPEVDLADPLRPLCEHAERGVQPTLASALEVGQPSRRAP